MRANPRRIEFLLLDGATLQEPDRSVDETGEHRELVADWS